MRNHLSDVVYRTYWEQLTYNYTRVTSNMPNAWAQAVHRNLGIFSALARTETWPLAGLLGVSPFVVLILWRTLHLRERALGLAAFAVTVFWLMNPGTVVSRVVLTFLPLLYLSFALMVARWDLMRRLGLPFQTAALLILVGISFSQTIRNGLMLRSPFKAATFYLQQQGFSGQVADVNCWPIWQFYENARMEFRPETMAPDFSHLQELMIHAIAENHPQAIPVIVYNGQSMESKESGETFSSQLFTLPLSAQWPMPYKQIPIFTTEAFGDAMTQETGDRSGRLELYWVDKSSMRRLFPG